MRITFIFIFCLTSSCCVLKKDKKLLHKETLVLNSIGKDFRSDGVETSQPEVVISEKIWYQDSCAIETVSGLFINSDSKGTTQEVKIMFYRFSDLLTRSAYDYYSFSDTSKLIRKYDYTDTSLHLHGGWGFYYKRKWVHNGEPEPLEDTVINNSTYKRLLLRRGEKQKENIAVCYFRCDKSTKVFIMDSLLSERIGCPLTRVYNYAISGMGLNFSTEIEFLSDTFTQAEQNVFDTWAKYAKDNPVLH